MAQAARDREGDRGTLVSVAQAAALLGVHPNTIRAWTDAGRLPAFRINARGDRRYRRAMSSASSRKVLATRPLRTPSATSRASWPSSVA